MTRVGAAHWHIEHDHSETGLLLRDARVKPAVNEMELHPHFQQPELFRFVLEHGIQPIGYCPLGSPNRPERDRTPEEQ